MKMFKYVLATWAVLVALWMLLCWLGIWGFAPAIVIATGKVTWLGTLAWTASLSLVPAIFVGILASEVQDG